jgi:hypothetical protein
VLLNRGDGGFQAKADYRTKGLPSSPAIGDLNGDGKPDLAIDTVEGISLLANRGDGTFSPHVELKARATGSVAIGDLNGDGRMDLVTAGGYAVYVLLNRGDGSFDPGVPYQTGTGPESIAIGDLNGDGRPDLATANGGDDTVSVSHQQRRRHVAAQARLRSGDRPCLRCDRRPERRRQAGPGGCERRHEERVGVSEHG